MAQINFEKGYFITNDNEKVDCLIRNVDWKNNPKKFDYRFTEKGEIRTEGISNVKGFGIIGFSKYLRKTVSIDRSSESTSHLSYEREPEWSVEEVFLKTLIEGKRSLFQFEKGNMIRFFYRLESDTIIQLISKKYLYLPTIANGPAFVVKTNNDFKQYLFLNINCQDKSAKEFKNLKYRVKELSTYFREENICLGGDENEPALNVKDERLHLKLALGVNFPALIIKNPDIKFGTETNLRFGIEGEQKLPFNNDKWGLLFEVVYQRYKSVEEKPTNSLSLIEANVNIKYLELGTGFRHYFYLNDHSSVFLNLMGIAELNIKNKINSLQRRFEMKKLSAGLAVGIGTKYKNFSIEYRYYNKRNNVETFFETTSKFNRSSIILGYTIF